MAVSPRTSLNIAVQVCVVSRSQSEERSRFRL